MIREIRQKEFAEEWLKTKWGILNLCPRFGKIYTTINILENLPEDLPILIAYPDTKIKKSWKDDFKKRGFDDRRVKYTTHLSLKKHKGFRGFIIIDEIHLLSEAQIEEISEICGENEMFLGLTGTMSKYTKKKFEDLGYPVIATYTIDQAIEEKIISDYRITIHKVPLDNIIKNNYNGKIRTEYQQFRAYSSVIEKLDNQGKSTKFLRLSRMRLIQNSISKLNKTKELLEKFTHERVLVFCGLIKIAEKLGCAVHHSKSNNEDEFNNFAEGEGKHLAVVRIGNTGKTYKPLNKIIINYFDSNSENITQKINRAMAQEFDNPNKVADIHIITSDEEVELRWLRRALEFFDNNKILWK